MGSFRGSLVSMADGSLKPIEDLAVGDKVLDYDKKEQRVDGIRSVRLIPYPQRTTVKINDKYVITDRHCILTRDNRFVQVNDKVARIQWMRLYPYVAEDSRIVYKFLFAADLQEYGLCGEMGLDTWMKTIDGPEQVRKIEVIDHPYDILFNHSVTGSGTYFVNGICITARLNEAFNYKEMKPYEGKVSVVAATDEFTKKRYYKRVIDLIPDENTIYWDYYLENWFKLGEGSCTPWTINIL
ncbi:Hint domain containing protein [uncultured Caudovirales phage]|uniref:Hint domain containing protein n=1 Tax=uncultured Caudovirales phage TaxID=2100421 RepID=A0A6J5QMP2_9CAUD|nr:Hint domain containing protein [uncultured Caudovirales phage]